MTLNEADLDGVLEDLQADSPPNVKKVMRAAIEHGWTLNKPGMTVALRLNHPERENAPPVYISWVLGRTPKGALSWKFNSCGTQTLIPLSGAELLEYLEDPNLILPDEVPSACDFHLCEDPDVFVWKAGGNYCDKHAKKAMPEVQYAKGYYGEVTDYNPEDTPPWDTDQTVAKNVQAQLGGVETLRMGVSPVPQPAPPLRVTAPPLRV